MKRTLIALCAIIVVLAAVYLLFLKANDNNSLFSGLFSGTSYGACDNTPHFTHLPIDEQYIQSIVPLGNLNPSGHTFPTDHVYFNFTEGAEHIPVYAPGDATVTTVSSAYNAWADPPFTDYSVNFMVCDDVEGYYIHVNELSTKLQTAFDANLDEEGCETYETGGREFTNCWTEVDIPITAGEIIATTAREDQSNFDLGVYDMTKKPYVFANPDRFEEFGQYPYTRCPFDYYPAEMQQTISGYLGDWGHEGSRKRTIEPVCGTIGQDVPGTAQGLWYIKGTPSPADRGEDAHMALVHDNIDPTEGVFSIGTSLEAINIPSAAYSFEPKDSGLINRDFDLVTADGNVYCYDAYGGSAANFENTAILITMPDADTLKIGPHAAPDCSATPYVLNEFVVFER